ncbi:MAG: putative acetyltransferase [Halomonas sp. 54_146]|nr:MAG: putative acetyltransferase [Halomonas sp. 54_146]
MVAGEELMTLQQALPFQAIQCPPSRRREALLQLAAAHDPAQQAALSAAIKAMYHQPEDHWDGLWITLEAGQLTGAIWVQRLPMNMAQLWLPKTEKKYADALLYAARRWVKTHNIRLCHVELLPEAPVSEALLIEHGMQCLACLERLTSGRRERRLAIGEATPLWLQPFGELSPPEQLALLAAVGQDSLDSRPLRDVLSIEELLAGFYQQDPQAPQHWYAVNYQGAVIGVLLLASHLASGHWELMLMGLTPKWRGQGLGRSLLNKALALAQQAGAQEVVLAVDAVNLPAKRLYQQAGFERYAQQHLLAWKGGVERGCDSSEAPK